MAFSQISLPYVRRFYSEIKFAARKKGAEKGIGVSFKAKIEVFNNLYFSFY